MDLGEPQHEIEIVPDTNPVPARPGIEHPEHEPATAPAPVEEPVLV